MPKYGPYYFPKYFPALNPICRDVVGMDATAAQTLGSLWLALRAGGAEMVLTDIRKPTMLRLLRAHGVALAAPDISCMAASQAEGIGGSSHVRPCLLFEELDSGARYCEERFLEVGAK